MWKGFIHLSKGPPVSVSAGLQQRCRCVRGEGLLGFLRRLPGCGNLLRWRGNVTVPQANPKSVRQNRILSELQEIVSLSTNV